MFKKLKKLLLALLIIPCITFLHGCGDSKSDPPANDDTTVTTPDTPTTPTEPEAAALTTAQKNAAVGCLKTALNDDHTQKGNTAFAKFEMVSDYDNVTIDFTNSNLPQGYQGMLPSMMFGDDYSQKLVAYNSDGTGYVVYKEGTNNTDLAINCEEYFVEGSDDKFIYYYADYQMDYKSAKYVDNQHAKFYAVERYVSNLNYFFGSVHKCDTFEEFVAEMKSQQLEDNGIAPNAEGVDISVDIELKDSIYTITGTCTMNNVEADMGNVIGTSNFVIKFNENTVLSYESIVDVSTQGIEFEDAMFEVPGEGTFSVNLELCQTEKFTFSDAYDNTNMKTDFSYLEIGEINNAQVSVNFVDKDGWMWNYGTNVDYTEGLSTENLILDINGIDVSDLTWYTDAACTHEFTGLNSLKSYETITLYTNEDVVVPNTHATVKEISSSGEKSVSYYNLGDTTSIDYEHWVEYYTVYVTVDDGEREELVGTTLNLEAGKTYIVEIVE